VSSKPKAVAAVALSFVYWGLVPIFWKQLVSVEPFELLAYRAVSVFACVTVVVYFSGGFFRLFTKITFTRRFGLQAAAAALLAVNWFTFTWGIITENILDTSLGYYLAPFVGLLWARFVGGETLSAPQILAFVLCAIGVSLLIYSEGKVPVVALVIATSWATYSFCKNQTRLPAFESLFFETGLMFPIATGLLIFRFMNGAELAIVSDDFRILGLVAVAGPVATVLLFMYGYGAKQISMVALSMLQFLGPTVSALVALIIYGEPLEGAKLACFGMIAAAIVLYSINAVRQQQRLSLP